MFFPGQDIRGEDMSPLFSKGKRKGKRNRRDPKRKRERRGFSQGGNYQRPLRARRGAPTSRLGKGDLRENTKA